MSSPGSGGRKPPLQLSEHDKLAASMNTITLGQYFGRNSSLSDSPPVAAGVTDRVEHAPSALPAPSQGPPSWTPTIPPLSAGILGGSDDNIEHAPSEQPQANQNWTPPTTPPLGASAAAEQAQPASSSISAQNPVGPQAHQTPRQVSSPVTSPPQPRRGGLGASRYASASSEPETSSQATATRLAQGPTLRPEGLVYRGPKPPNSRRHDLMGSSRHAPQRDEGRRRPYIDRDAPLRQNPASSPVQDTNPVTTPPPLRQDFFYANLTASIESTGRPVDNSYSTASGPPPAPPQPHQESEELWPHGRQEVQQVMKKNLPQPEQSAPKQPPPVDENKYAAADRLGKEAGVRLAEFMGSARHHESRRPPSLLGSSGGYYRTTTASTRSYTRKPQVLSDPSRATSQSTPGQGPQDTSALSNTRKKEDPTETQNLDRETRKSYYLQHRHEFFRRTRENMGLSEDEHEEITRAIGEAMADEAEAYVRERARRRERGLPTERLLDEYSPRQVLAAAFSEQSIEPQATGSKQPKEDEETEVGDLLGLGPEYTPTKKRDGDGEGGNDSRHGGGDLGLLD